MNQAMTKITIITREEKFETLRKELIKIGVPGMTISKVDGCGKQHGIQKLVEGVLKHFALSPKIRIDIVVCSVPVEAVIETAKSVLQTGKIGDGKIFTSEIKHVVRIRTGEVDKEAL